MSVDCNVEPVVAPNPGHQADRFPPMLRLFRTAVIVAIAAATRVEAQCSDGSPAPCRSPARVDTNAFVVLPFAVSGPASAQYLSNAMVDLLHMALDGVGRM